MEDIKISIIVPVYNTDKYLCECLDSILAQTFSNFELMLINDGSTDSSSVICNEYALKDSRVRVFHKDNGGVSSARNLGLDNAKGKYVMFMDADDYWYDSSAVEQLYENAEFNDVDIIRGEYKAVDVNGETLFERPISQRKMGLAQKTLSTSVFYKDIICGENFLVLALIKKKCIGNLRFNTSRVFLEDMEFYAKLLMNPLRCMYVPLRFYAYRKNAESASNKPNKRNLADSFSMCDIFDECCAYLNDGELKKAYRYNSVMMYYWTLKTLTNDAYYDERKKIISDLKLCELQKKVSAWVSFFQKTQYPMFVYLNPYISSFLLRQCSQIKMGARKLLNHF